VSKTVLKTTVAFLSLSLATVLLGCGEEPVPAEPGYAADVRPIFVARCVRCHGAGDKLNGDPLSLAGAPPTNGYLQQYDDSGPCLQDPLAAACKRGALYYGKIKPALIFTGRLHSSGDDRMPPLPAETLSDHQIQVIERWTTEATPKP
jgi:mono/diheme cytochrome c family protein